MNNILLLNPWIHDFAAYDLWIQPIFLFKLSTYFKQQGYNVDFINCLDRYDPDLVKFLGKLPKTNKDECGKFYKQEINKPDVLSFVPRKYYRYGLPLEIVKQKLEQIAKPDIVFIASVMTYWYPAVVDMIRLVKEFFPNSKIVLGGTYPALLPEHARQYSGADYIWPLDRREGSYDSVITRLDYVLLRALLFRKRYALARVIQSLNVANTPQDRTLLTNQKVHILQTSTGCPCKCTYCASQKIFPKFQQTDPDLVVKEMVESVTKTNTQHFVFYDDALLVNADKHIKIILDKWLQYNLSKQTMFHTPNGLHAKYLDKEVAELMKKSNFKTIRLSLETTDENLQKQKGGKVYNQDFIQAVENLKQAGFAPSDIETYIMMGLPGQTEEQLLKDMFWAHKLGVKIVLASYSPIPGTKDFDELSKKGIINKDDDPLVFNNTIFVYKLGFAQEKIRKYRGIASELNDASEDGMLMKDISEIFI